MPTRLFRVDMSETSRDFAAVATEPGLAMLDAQRVNYTILYKWLGPLVAEPELNGPQLASFYVREQERGRLENVTCVPATKKDLEGPLKADLEQLEQGIRKAKPESATEQVLHRIITKTFRELTANLDTSDFHHYFFKYRAGGEAARLVWCWGYQRKDMEPARTLICTNLDCHQIFVYKPKGSKRCPACSTVPVKKKRGAGVIFSPAGLALLLLLLLGLFFYLNQPKLVVNPTNWAGPRGSRVMFLIEDQRWFFFREDVTDRTVSQSHNPSIFAFDRSGTEGRAKNQGDTFLTFRHGSLSIQATVNIGPPIPPRSLTIEPENVEVAVDATAKIKIVGHYDEMDDLDLTDETKIEIPDAEIAYAKDGRVYGVSEGTTKLIASYRATEKDDEQTVEAEIKVVPIEFASLEIELDANPLAISQHGTLRVLGVTKEGRKEDLIGSKKLNLTISPAGLVRREDEYLIGQQSGTATIAANFGDLAQSLDFTVGDSLLADGTFEVYPKVVEIAAGTYQDLNVVSSGSDPIESRSSDETVASIDAPDPWLHRLKASKVGTATITLSQGGQEQVIDVTVVANDVQAFRIEPPHIEAYVGEQTNFSVVGERASGTTVEILPEHFEVIRQPRIENADFDRVGYAVFGLQPSAEDDRIILEYNYGDKPQAVASVSVKRRLETDIGDDLWVAHPPIIPGATRWTVPGGALLGGNFDYVPGRGVVVGSDIPLGLAGKVQPGEIITSIGGTDIRNLGSRDEVVRILGGLRPTDVVTVMGSDGQLMRVPLAAGINVSADVAILQADATNVTATDFGANLQVNVRYPGEYRIAAGDDTPLSDWTMLDAGVAMIRIPQIPRASGQSDYQIFVERKQGDSAQKQAAYTIRIE